MKMTKITFRTYLNLCHIGRIRLKVLDLFHLVHKSACLIPLTHQIVIHNERVPGVDNRARL